MSDETPKPYTPDSILWWLQRVDEVVQEAVQDSPAPLLMKASVMANLLQVQVMERQAEALERIAAALKVQDFYSRVFARSERIAAVLESQAVSMPREPVYAPDDLQIYQCRNCQKLGRANFFGTPCENAPAGDPVGAHKLDRLECVTENGDTFLQRKPL